jgi:hypothetical protein
MGGFEIGLLAATWLVPEREDQCAHGTVHIRIGDADVVVDDLNVAFGARGALATLEVDHRSIRQEPLIPHACSLVLGCPNLAVDWSVRHLDGQAVMLGDLSAQGTRNAVTEQGDRTPVVIPLLDYRRSVVAFATAVRGFYGPPGHKVITSEWERQTFDEFWADFDRLYEEHSQAD